MKQPRENSKKGDTQMALDIRSLNVGKTADKIALKHLLAITSYQGKVTIPWGKPTSEAWSVPIEDVVEDNEEEVWEAYLELEARYSNLSRMFAES